MRLGWDHPETARYYAAFCRAHSRYAEANWTLAQHAGLRAGDHVLDIAAGTGETARAALACMPRIEIVCFEPAAAMREAGLRDPRVQWVADWPAGSFDVALCGAAMWQLLPLRAWFGRIRERVERTLAFNIPAAYLGLPDLPGGGADPYLCGLLAALGRAAEPDEWEPLSVESVESALAGFGFECWEHEHRLTQEELRDWMKIPVLTDALMPDLDAAARAAALDSAYAAAGPSAGSWRWERWVGWTASPLASSEG